MKYLVWNKGRNMVVKTEGIKEAREEAFMTVMESRRLVYIGAQNNDRITDSLNRNDQTYCVKHKSNGGRTIVAIADRKGLIGFLDRNGNVVKKPIAYTKDEAFQKYRRL